MASSPYNEKIRDNGLISRVADEGLSEETVSQILLETFRQFFLNASNFSSRRMRHRDPALLWTNNPATSRVRIVRDIDWDPKTMGATPEIVIRSHGTLLKKINVQGFMEAYEETVEDPTTVIDLVTGRAVIWSISPSGEEARMLAWELAQMLSAFSEQLCKEYGLATMSPGGVNGPVRIKERKGYWGVPVTLGYQWQMVQEVIEQQPRLAEILGVIETSENGALDPSTPG